MQRWAAALPSVTAATRIFSSSSVIFQPKKKLEGSFSFLSMLPNSLFSIFFIVNAPPIAAPANRVVQLSDIRQLEDALEAHGIGKFNKNELLKFLTENNLPNLADTVKAKKFYPGNLFLRDAK